MTRSKKILNIFTAIIVGLFLGCTVASFAIRAKTQPKVETVQPTQYSFALGQEWVDVLTVPRKAVLSETKSFFDEEGTEYQYEQYYVYVATSSLGLFGEVFDAERVNVSLFPIENYALEEYHPEYGIYIHAGSTLRETKPSRMAGTRSRSGTTLSFSRTAGSTTGIRSSSPSSTGLKKGCG